VKDNCQYCGNILPDSKSGRKRRKDKLFCSQKCHDKDKYSRASKQVKKFKNDFGLNKYTIKGIEKKLQLIEMFGGKCEKCGYDKNIAAFDFHHIDPFSKIFEIKIQYLKHKSDDDILEEALKCMLLCANCHREHHNPHMEIKHVERVLKLIK
jgi:hypothetical protein